MVRGRWLWVVVAAIGCSTAVVPVNTVAPKASPAGAAKVANDAIAALSSGNIDALLQLAAPRELYAALVMCTKQPAEPVTDALHDELSATYRASMAPVDGATIELLGLGDSRTEPVGLARRGEPLGEGCQARVDGARHVVDAWVQLRRGETSRKQAIEIVVYQVGERYFLGSFEAGDRERRRRSGSSRTAVAKMKEFVDAMCACAPGDTACANEVVERQKAYADQMAKTADRDARPDPDLAKKLEPLMARYTKCATTAYTPVGP